MLEGANDLVVTREATADGTAEETLGRPYGLVVLRTREEGLVVLALSVGILLVMLVFGAPGVRGDAEKGFEDRLPQPVDVACDSNMVTLLKKYDVCRTGPRKGIDEAKQDERDTKAAAAKKDYLAAIISRDYPVVMATLFMFSMLAVVSQLLSDLSLILVDPRISFESAAR